ncbi:hypothetical protein [Glutamicibacter arilaitensis]|uniref:hypothetical protein n=1 Tax=Glutamicibacter arilaitensis TaxID=256701 RepID=UPI00384C0AC0
MPDLTNSWTRKSGRCKPTLHDGGYPVLIPNVSSRSPAPVRMPRTRTSSWIVSVALGAGFGGHGFKFVPAIGEHLADMATSACASEPIFAANRKITRPLILERRHQVELGQPCAQRPVAAG